MDNIRTQAEDRQHPGHDPAQMALGIPLTETEQAARQEKARRILENEERYYRAYGPQSGYYQGRFVGYGREEF